MKRIVTGFFLGVAVTAAVLMPVLISQQREKFEHGRHQGRTDGGLAVVEFLDTHFRNEMPMTHQPTNVVEFFGFKDRVIVIKTEDEVITLETQ